MRMRPMNSQESGFSQPLIRFSDLLEDHEIAVEVREPELRKVVEEVCRGGWLGWRDLRTDAVRKCNGDHSEEGWRTGILYTYTPHDEKRRTHHGGRKAK